MADGVEHHLQLLERPADGVARAGGVLEVDAAVAGDVVERRGDRGADPPDGALQGVALRRPHVQHHPGQAELLADREVLAQALLRRAVEVAGLRRRLAGWSGGLLLVRRAEVDEVQPVRHERPHTGGLGLRAEPRDLLRLVVDGSPGARVVGEHLEALAADRRPAVDRVADAAGGRDMGTEPHPGILVTLSRAVATTSRPRAVNADQGHPPRAATHPPRDHRAVPRQVRTEPHRQPARGRCPHRAVQLADRPQDRRHVRAAPGGHRPGAQHPGERGGDPAGAALAGTRLGRGSVPPERARRRVPRRDRADEGERDGVPGVRDRATS